MIRVLIVDDEKIIREGLTRLIERDCPGFEVVGEAADGEAALHLTQTLSPDIVVVDLRMPVMGGIDYMRLAVETGNPPRFVVLTGYADFEYARQVIGLGGAGYLLKPVKHAELKALLMRLGEEVLHTRQERERHAVVSAQAEQGLRLRREDVLRSLAIGKLTGMEDGVAQCGLACLETPYYLAYISIDHVFDLRVRLSSSGMDESILSWYGIPAMVEALLQDSPYGGVTASVTDRTTALIITGFTSQNVDGIKAFLHDVQARIRQETGLSVTIGYDGPYQGFAAYQQANDRCNCAVGYRFYDGRGQVFVYDANRPLHGIPDVYQEEKQMLAALDMGNGPLVRQMLEEMFEKTRVREVRKTAVTLFCSKLYVEIINLLTKKGRFAILEAIPSYSNFESHLAANDLFSELRDFFNELVERIIQGLEGGPETSNRKVVRIAMHYVEEHVGEAFGANEVATAIGINPSYFSVLFKKETGENFISYVNRLKMERAKKLLQDPLCKVYEVCGQLGYEDSKYFARIFRKTVGMTPSEYREGLSGNPERP